MHAGRNEPLSLTITRVFDAPRALVFETWSKPEHLRRWWGPKGFTLPTCEMTFEQGRTYRWCMRSPDGKDYWMEGVWKEIVPDRRIVFTAAIGDGNDTEATITFEDHDGGKTKVTMRQTYAFASDATRGAEAGWSQSLDRLGDLLDGEAPARRAARSSSSVHRSTFVIERTFPASPKRVFAAFADLETKGRWFLGGGGWKKSEHTLDFRVGGREHLAGGSPGAEPHVFDALYYDIVPGERIIYAYEMHIGDRRISVSLATITLEALETLEAVGAGTRFVLTEQGAYLDGQGGATSRERGTIELMDKLAASLGAAS